MAKLTAKQEAFIKYMTESDELSRHGFELLLQRPNFEQFFDALSEAGLFDPARNPGPVPAEEEGYVRIPFWPPLDYLVAVAKLAGERDDVALAEKVMAVIRAVSTWRDGDGRHRENHHTWRKFAEVFGLVPTRVITVQDARFVSLWVSDRFDRGMVGADLDEGALKRLLSSELPDDWDKAVEILRHCTAIRWESDESRGSGSTKPVSAVDDYWLKRLIANHSKAFGRRVGQKTAELFRERIREIFVDEGRRLYSRTYRPAIEDHSQNHNWHGVENRPIEGLRDVVLSWCDVQPAAATVFVEQLLKDELEILRRIGIYVISQRWDALNGLYSAYLGPALFSTGHLHELYNLLNERFVAFDNELKASTVRVIHDLPAPDWADDPVRSLKGIQQRWLSAIVGKGYPAADESFSALQTELGPLSDHPDFSTYMTSWSGPGATPYSVQDLLVFADQNVLIEKLNAFQPGDLWRGPTMEALTSTLEEASKSTPGPFLRMLSRFLQAKIDFQHAVIRGLKQAWDASGATSTDVDWIRGWSQVIEFFEALIGDKQFWEQDRADGQGHRPTRRWIVSDVAEFIEAGTKNDGHAFPAELLPRTQTLIQALLKNDQGVQEPADDAMTQAINASRGKVIEALFSQALMVCRAGDRTRGSHAEEWANIAPLFEAELSSCQNRNYEFSTLAGAYLPQLEYMDSGWTEARIDQIFPAAFPANEMCAIDGLAYATFTRRSYLLLRTHGVIDRSLRYELKGHAAREKILERIAAAYMWGDEELEGERFSYLFETARVDDLETIARVFWGFRDEKLSDDQRNRVKRFWERCLAWSQGLPRVPAQFMSALSTLSGYLMSADGPERILLEAVASYIHVGYNADTFIEQLTRLVEVSPDGVSAVLGRVLEAHAPFYDYQDRLKTLLERLVEKGKKQDVIAFAEKLRSLKGIPELFDRLTRGG